MWVIPSTAGDTEEVPPSPLLLLYTTAGLLCPFWVIRDGKSREKLPVTVSPPSSLPSGPARVSSSSTATGAGFSAAAILAAADPPVPATPALSLSYTNPTTQPLLLFPTTSTPRQFPNLPPPPNAAQPPVYPPAQFSRPPAPTVQQTPRPPAPTVQQTPRPPAPTVQQTPRPPAPVGVQHSPTSAVTFVRPQFMTSGVPQPSTAVRPQFMTSGVPQPVRPQFMTSGIPQPVRPQLMTSGVPQPSTAVRPQLMTSGVPQPVRPQSAMAPPSLPTVVLARPSLSGHGAQLPPPPSSSARPPLVTLPAPRATGTDTVYLVYTLLSLPPPSPTHSHTHCSSHCSSKR